jgi:hypothetical protein
MNAVLDSYQSIERETGFYEVVFRDFKRSTLQTWLDAADERYPTLRILYDLRALISFTPYALYCFRKTIYREYPANTRAAFVVQGNLLNVLLQAYIKRYQQNKGKGFGRVFFDYDAALDWLKD